MLKNSLFQPSLSFCFSTFLPFSASATAFLLSLFRLPFFSLQHSPFFFFFFYFQPYLFKVQPFTCCSLTQPKKPNTAQKAQTFFSFSAQTFLLQFSHSFFLFFLLYSFLVQPKNVTFIPKRFFSFLQVALYFSAQVFSSKPFSAASCLFI